MIAGALVVEVLVVKMFVGMLAVLSLAAHGVAGVRADGSREAT
jgi:hypothetical protein